MSNIAGPPATNLFMVLPWGAVDERELMLCACDESGHILRRHFVGLLTQNPDLNLMGERIRRFSILEIRRAMVGP